MTEFSVCCVSPQQYCLSVIFLVNETILSSVALKLEKSLSNNTMKRMAKINACRWVTKGKKQSPCYAFGNISFTSSLWAKGQSIQSYFHWLLSSSDETFLSWGGGLFQDKNLTLCKGKNVGSFINLSPRCVNNAGLKIWIRIRANKLPHATRVINWYYFRETADVVV